MIPRGMIDRKRTPIDALSDRIAVAIYNAPVVQHQRGVNGFATKKSIAQAVERVLREHVDAVRWTEVSG